MKSTVILLIIFCIKANAQLPCNRVPTNQQLLEALSRKPVEVSRNHFVIGCNVNDSVKRRLLLLLNWKWTDDEIENYLNETITRLGKFYRIEERSKAVSKGNDSLYKHAKDSIIKKIKLENYNTLLKSNAFRVNDGIILTVANLYYYEAIPILKKALEDSIHYNKTVTELALARLGNTKFQDKIISQCIYKNELEGSEWINYYNYIASKLLFIATQESIYKLNEWLDTSKMSHYRTIGSGPDTKNAYDVIIDLKNVILNRDFQEKTEGIGDEAVGQKANEPILYCKEWLIKNKGRYEINKYYCPY